MISQKINFQNNLDAGYLVYYMLSTYDQQKKCITVSQNFEKSIFLAYTTDSSKHILHIYYMAYYNIFSRFLFVVSPKVRSSLVIVH